MNTEVVFFYKRRRSTSYRVPVAVTDNATADQWFLSENQKKAIYKKWPEAKGNLFVLFQGWTFKVG